MTSEQIKVALDIDSRQKVYCLRNLSRSKQSRRHSIPCADTSTRRGVADIIQMNRKPCTRLLPLAHFYWQSCIWAASFPQSTFKARTASPYRADCGDSRKEADCSCPSLRKCRQSPAFFSGVPRAKALSEFSPSGEWGDRTFSET